MNSETEIDQMINENPTTAPVVIGRSDLLAAINAQILTLQCQVEAMVETGLSFGLEIRIAESTIKKLIHQKQLLASDRVPCSMPWMMEPLDEWAIVGMNHYHIEGEKRLFVSMTKEGRCITEEGRDDKYLWNRLWHKATEA